MSRIRYIKPGFFTDDDLLECDPLARLLFVGLWTEADRAGRLEDRPRRLKLRILPADDCDADALLDQLAARRLIIRYALDDKRYISIPGWKKHQYPHVREAESTIPAPDEYQACLVLTPHQHRSSPLDNGERITDNRSKRVAHSDECAALSGQSHLPQKKPTKQQGAGPYHAEFEKWYDVFAYKKQPSRAAELYRYWRERGASADDLLTAARNYREDCNRETRTSQYPQTFLAKNLPPWKDWLDPSVGQPASLLTADEWPEDML